MALGLGSLGKKAKKADKPAEKKPKTDDDAADILKKMDEKSAAGDCPFC